MPVYGAIFRNSPVEVGCCIVDAALDSRLIKNNGGKTPWLCNLLQFFFWYTEACFDADLLPLRENNDDGWTPLHQAYDLKSSDTEVKALLRGSKKTVVVWLLKNDVDGNTPLLYAIRCTSSMKVIKLLFGADKTPTMESLPGQRRQQVDTFASSNQVVKKLRSFLEYPRKQPASGFTQVITMGRLLCIIQLNQIYRVMLSTSSAMPINPRKTSYF